MRTRRHMVKAYIDEETYSKLKRYCEQQKISISTFIYILLKKFFIKKERREM